MFARSMFRNIALLSGLVTQEQLDQVVATLRTQPQPGLPPTPMLDVDDDQLASKLVELGILTPYQLKELKAGRSKFTLGSYTITDWIGQGGMGHVYKGVHQVMGRECAIKTLPLVKATPESISNFNREIRTQAQLDHPHLVRAYDAGKDGNIYYMAVEYVPGTDLRKLVRSQGPLTQTQAASVILQTARGLEYAHGKGLIHRDIKPGNILVTAEGIAKLSDLGLAGFLHDAANDPRAGKIVGTADYLSPEQIRSPGDITLTTDIYSLGCTLYYAVCGKVPFPGGTARDKARRHCEETPWHPRRFNPDLHEEFVEVIADMMEKDPKARIQTAAEVVARLEQFAENAAPLKTPASIKSPWSSQPLPSGEFEKDEIGQDTDGGEVSASEASASHGSQGTGAVASGTQETMPMKPGRHRPLPVAQAVPLPEPFSATAIVALTLVISIPLSMAAGALVAALAFWLFG